MTTYAELQQAIIEDSHRPDLALLVPRFIRECEGMIRRELNAYILGVQLLEADRVAPGSPQYTLPVDALIIRNIALSGRVGASLSRIALSAITGYPLTDRVAVYAEPGTGVIEFRGSPPEDSIFDLSYFGIPAPLVDPTDTNTLLDENETLYKAGAMFYLFQNTQDKGLAQDQLSVFDNVITTLNEEIARKIGGLTITPSYNFSLGSAY
jgi:hypothetical protein